ncbi:MAG: XdhC family protein, partial [Candidatus Limnocylindrales bacterium]
GLVASPTRAAAVRSWLLDEGIEPDRVLAVRAPAGLDLGAESAAEVALSILAELVQVRHGRAGFVAAPGPAILAGAAATTSEPVPALDDIVLLDPVCGMTVERADARHLAEHGGVVYAFCSIGCRSRFVREPSAYVGTGATSGG